MSRRRSKRYVSDADKQSFLAKAGELRDACVGMQTRGPINDPLYRSIAEVMSAIDAVAEVMTGRRDHFHTRMFSATSHLRGFSESQATAEAEPASLHAVGTVGAGRCGGE